LPHVKESDVLLLIFKGIGGEMVVMLASNVVDLGFEHQSGQTKNL